MAVLIVLISDICLTTLIHKQKFIEDCIQIQKLKNYLEKRK